MASQTVQLRSGEGESFSVSVEVAKCSRTIRTLLEDNIGGSDNDDGDDIPLANISSEILQRIISWAEYHKNDPVEEVVGGQGEPTNRIGGGRHVPITEWDTQFFDVTPEILYALALAANYLDMKKLLDMTTQTIAERMIQGKNPREIRAAFNLDPPTRSNHVNGAETMPGAAVAEVPEVAEDGEQRGE